MEPTHASLREQRRANRELGSLAHPSDARLVQAKASETCAGILVVLAVPFPESFVDYVFILALSLMWRRLI